MRRPAYIFFANPDERGFNGEPGIRPGPVGQQQVFFTDAALRELFRELMVGGGGFAKDEHAAGFLVQAMQNGQGRPARFAVAQPVVEALTGVWGGCVRVPAGGLADHQQMFILKNDARRHVRMKTFLPDKSKFAVRVC